MLKPSEKKRQGSFKIKFTVIGGYILVVAVMALGLFTLYNNLVNYSDKRIRNEDMSDLLIVGNTLSMLYEIESEQNLINAQNAEQYFIKYDSIAPKIKENIEVLKSTATDSSRVSKLDSIQSLVDLKRENLQEVAVLLDSISRAPKLLRQTDSRYIPKQLNREIADYIESRNLNRASNNQNDTSRVVRNRKGFLDRVRDVFVANPDSMLVIEKKSIVSDNDLKLIVDTIINKVRYSERLDLRRQREFQLAYLARQEEMTVTNRMLTSRIDELLKGIEHEELEKSIQLLKEKEQTLKHSQNAMFIAFCVALFIAFIFAVLFLVDINKSQRYRRQLEASNKRISNLLASREKLMLTISHDIKAPMSSILGFIELIDTHADPKNEGYLHNMKSSGKHILELASALLDYHKLEEGSWQLKETNFNLHKLVNDTVAGFEPLAMKKGLTYIVDNKLSQELTIYSDPYMLRQILNNIISNAVKYTAEGSVTIKAYLDTEESDQRMVFSVIDTGMGIDDAERQLIFEEFSQLDNPIGEEGSGLGLAITKGFVEALNGTINVNSSKGEGSEFIVEIPVSPSKANELQSEVHDARTTDYDLQGVSVLLVDDDAVQLVMTSELLARQKVTCLTEQNPSKVLGLLESSSFNILFMDIQMPAMDGYKLVEKIRQSDNQRIKNMIVIALSARTDISREEMRSAGFTDFLAKPFTPDNLYRIINNYVRGNINDNETSKEESNTGNLEEKGPIALIEYVYSDVQTSVSILQSFVDETRKSRIQLENVFQLKEEKKAQAIVHKILPLFRLMGDKELVPLMEKLEKGEQLVRKDQLFVLNGIDKHIEKAEILKNELKVN